MSDALTHELEQEARDARAHQPSDGLYVLVAFVLAVVTGLEVSVTYIHTLARHHAEVPLLLVLMAIKFGMVIWYFMHLKFDPVLCRRVFLFGLVLAVAVYVIMLAVFRFWAAHFV